LCGEWIFNISGDSRGGKSHDAVGVNAAAARENSKGKSQKTWKEQVTDPPQKQKGGKRLAALGLRISISPFCSCAVTTQVRNVKRESQLCKSPGLSIFKAQHLTEIKEKGQGVVRVFGGHVCVSESGL
jgi:hypothetical protein